MPTTRKKVIKTVYKDDGSDEDTGDFSDSGSEAHISEESESSDAQEDPDIHISSDNESRANNKGKVSRTIKKTKFAKSFITKINKQSSVDNEENGDMSTVQLTVKDLTDADKLLPPVLNLSESDSSDDEGSTKPEKAFISKAMIVETDLIESEAEDKIEYKDVWSQNIQDDSEEIAKKTFMELEQHKSTIEKTKASLQNYRSSLQNEDKESNVKDLLALGEEVLPSKSPVKKKSKSKKKVDSDSEIEDWEEVKESKGLPQQGLQLYVEFPDAVRKKTKTLDVEMMMKRKMNRVKKEYQVYMHKVHVLCWLGHGNYVSRVLNDQDLMAAALSLLPSKESYPGERVDIKYMEQITTWYKDKLTLKQDKNEDKFRPKAPPLKEILLEQIKKKVSTTKKYIVFIFVAMLRALGLQCRIMFNFVTLPIKPPSTELCSLSVKKETKNDSKTNLSTIKEEKVCKNKSKKATNPKISNKSKLPQVDGSYDGSDFECSNIMQLDGNDDNSPKIINSRCKRVKKLTPNDDKNIEEVSPPLITKTGLSNINHSKKPDPKILTAMTQVKSKQNKGAEPDSTNILQVNESIDKVNSHVRNTRANKKKLSGISSNSDISENNTSKDNKQKPKPAPKKQNKHVPLNKKPANDASNINNLNSEKKLLPNSSVAEKDVKPKKVSTEASNLDNVIELNKRKNNSVTSDTQKDSNKRKKLQILVTDENEVVSSKFFDSAPSVRQTRKRSQSSKVQQENSNQSKNPSTQSTPSTREEKSKYFDQNERKAKKPRLKNNIRVDESGDDGKRVSHRDIIKKSKPKNDVTRDLVNIIKARIKDAKAEAKKAIVKGKAIESGEDSDYLPEEVPKQKYESDDDFKPKKIISKPSTSKKIDRRVLSSDDERPSNNRVDVWCEVFVEELEQWVCVDIFKAKLHAKDQIYQQATHPVCYVVGWDNNNYLKDLTRKYVPHWNTVTRKQRVEPAWWNKAIKPWLGPKTARDREEDEYLDKLQLEAPLPKSIAEYKNHPLYALKRHLLKFEAIYPPEAATLGFVRGEPVYARDCVYVCRSRDTWLKEAKVVRLGETPYKIVKARPKWDKLSNKLITDKPLEVFGPWQVQDYEPPVAENGIVPRNAYGNVELFKDCMLPKGTVHVKLPGLNKVARKLNIDCAPAMTGFDFNGGWSHPVFDGFVVCKEFEEVITEAWLKDQEEQERREREKIETRVYGYWKRLIKGLLIRERLKIKYGFEKPSTSKEKVKPKGPKLVVKKK